MSDEHSSHGDMESRVARLEADVAAIKIDVAVIKANGATKADVAEVRFDLSAQIKELRSETSAKIDSVRAEFPILRSEIYKAVAEGRTAIILWVAGIVVVGQFLPMITQFVKDIS